MALEFPLPEIGEGVVEGEIVEWHVKPGDSVSQDTTLVSILTDKATVEITATFDGVINSTFAEPGESVLVGATLCTYSEQGASPEPAAPAAPKNVATAQASQNGNGNGDHYHFPLPEIGEGVIEGEVVEWHVAAGDTISHDQPVVSVLTDKATVEITAPVDGRVVSVNGEPGDSLEVGQEIMVIEVAKGAANGLATGVPAPTEKTSTAAAQAVAASAIPSVDPADNPSISAFGTPLATPSVRRLAVEKGVALETVVGTGPKHRILREDVIAAANAPKTPAPEASSPAVAAPVKAPVSAPTFAPTSIAQVQGDRREKLRGLRKAIHTSMTRSKSIIPHFTYVDEVEMDALVKMRKEIKGLAGEMGVKLTFLPFIIKAVVAGLKKFPILNASMDDEAGEIVYKGAYNIGIATATEAGLTVPVLKHADQKSILQIAAEVAELSQRARDRRSTTDDITGGTFTLTSLGRLGGLHATPIINHPEVGIMGIHNLQERAVVRDGQIVIRQMMNISVSFDHRIVDGDVGATFAQEVKSYLEQPGKLMLQMT